MAIAGRVAIVPKGDWSAETEYKRLDEVTYNNTMFIAKKAVPKGTLPTNAEYWSKSIVGGAGSIATKEDAGIVKPADGLTVAEDGSLKVSIDGTTLTMDQVNNVIKLADTLKDKIGDAFPSANVANNQVTTEAGFALDARQANPNIDGTLAKQVADLNRQHLKVIDCGIACFSRSDSMVDIGTIIKTSVTFNRVFVDAPIIVVSWRESTAIAYCDYVHVDAAGLSKKGFNAITQTRRGDTLKYTWWFHWIAIGQ